MEFASPFSSLSTSRPESSSFGDVPIQQSLLLPECLEGLRNMRSQFYTAAEYFELSYTNDDQKEIVSRTLKDYAVMAISNAAEHLCSASYKVNDLLNKEADEVSLAEFEVSCIEQRLRTCQACLDQEGFSQQSLLIRPPKYHKHYILQASVGESAADQSMMKNQRFYPFNENRKVKQHHTANRRRRPPLLRNVPSQSPTPSPSIRELTLSTLQLPQLNTSHPERRITSSAVVSTPPLTLARSAANKPSIPNSFQKHTLESQNSLPISMYAERKGHKDMERSASKKRGFLKSLLKKNYKSWTDDSLFNYLDEY